MTATESYPRWALVQYRRPDDDAGARPRLGIGMAGYVHEAPAELADLTMTDLLDAWGEHEQLLRRISGAGSPPTRAVPTAELLAPVTFPRKVLCAGANYYDHAEEMGTARPDPAAEPYFFAKAPTVSVVGPDAAVRLPKGPGTKLDWEAELGVVIGRHAKDLAPADVPHHVAGYLVANDLSDRGSFPRENAVFPPFGWDWLAHKSFDGSCPTGPGLVPAWEVGDPQALDISLTVNGEPRQSSTTASMVVGVYGLVAAASRLMTLEPGDLVLTGTPAGVGMPKGTFLVAGDEVTVSIAGIGRIITHIEGEA